MSTPKKKSKARKELPFKINPKHKGKEIAFAELDGPFETGPEPSDLEYTIVYYDAENEELGSKSFKSFDAAWDHLGELKKKGARIGSLASGNPSRKHKAKPKKAKKGGTRTRGSRRSGNIGHSGKPKPRKKTVKRGNPYFPNRATDYAVLVELGAATEINLESSKAATFEEMIRYSWSIRAMRLTCDSSGTVLILFKRKAPIKRSADLGSGVQLAKGKGVFRAFKGFDANRFEAHALNDSQLHAIGRARSIAYHSDKWGDRAEYVHDFSSNVTVYATPKEDVILLAGGRLNVTPQGIAG